MNAAGSRRLGFGVSGPLGQKWFSAGKTERLIGAALDLGVARFDTAPFYFDAEKRLGAALAALGGGAAFVSTKTGTRRAGRGLLKDFSERAIREDVEGSLRRLGRDRLDLLYLHGPSVREVDDTRPVLEALKAEGKIAAFGVCGEGEPVAHAVRAGFDAVMAPFNLIDRRHAAVFAEAKERGVVTVAIAPMAQGAFGARLAAPTSLADLWRLARDARRPRYGAEAVAAARRAIGGLDPAAAAIGFVLASPAVDVAMTTTTRIAHLLEIADAAEKPLDPADYERLNALSLDRKGPGA